MLHRLLLGFSAMIFFACDGDAGRGDPPSAALDAPSWVAVGTRGKLDASGSEDPDHDIVLYRFTIADGTATQVVNTPSIEHIFRIRGVIEVAVVVVDSAGNESRAAAIVSVR